MRLFVFGLCCTVIWGCNTNTPPASTTATRSNSPTNAATNQPASGRPVATTPAADPTNTEVNVRDRSNATKTPLDQNENKADVQTTADIRKRVVAAKVSVNAQNVKIITQDGQVTLRGPVESEEEKRQIEEIASDVAGADRVDSQLEVNRK